MIKCWSLISLPTFILYYIILYYGTTVLYAVRRWPKRRYAAHDCMDFVQTARRIEATLHVLEQYAPTNTYSTCCDMQSTQTDIMVRSVRCMQWFVHKILNAMLWQQTTKEWIIHCWSGSLWLHTKPLRNFSHSMQTHSHCIQLRTLLMHHLSNHLKLEHNINNSY